MDPLARDAAPLHQIGDLPTVQDLKDQVPALRHGPGITTVARRARFAFSASPSSSRDCADQVRDVMDLLLPELSPADSLVDWAAVTAGEFVAYLLHAVEGKITCELRMDGEHLHVSVEAFDRCEGACMIPGAGRQLVDVISTDAGTYVNSNGKRVMWAAAEIIPVGVAAA